MLTLSYQDLLNPQLREAAKALSLRELAAKVEEYRKEIQLEVESIAIAFGQRDEKGSLVSHSGEVPIPEENLQAVTTRLQEIGARKYEIPTEGLSEAQVQALREAIA